MKDLTNLVEAFKPYFKLFWLMGLLSISFSNCTNNEKIETYRKTGEVQYQDLIKQMEAKYINTKSDTVTTINRE